ncbi:hypothetical protein NDU88_003993 [Pleurodeles waltl]|uniref:Uncharacterized protein n=1 Tax=Pleurodeles waltl TaxID=8319 RepID=A0AAV7W3Q4_PLEWA|nr:hypothetical protein NDU88_003993 [Pleurodeles waltl]
MLNAMRGQAVWLICVLAVLTVLVQQPGNLPWSHGIAEPLPCLALQTGRLAALTEPSTELIRDIWGEGRNKVEHITVNAADKMQKKKTGDNAT